MEETLVLKPEGHGCAMGQAAGRGCVSSDARELLSR